MLLIQTGGLGIAAFGVGVAVMSHKKVGLRDRQLVKESWNIGGYGGLVVLLRRVLVITAVCEGAGAILSALLFMRDMPTLKALGYGIFHAVSAFNNAGFDLNGGFSSLTGYYGDAALNIVTAALIITGGLGFIVLLDLRANGLKARKFSLHTKVVLCTTAALLVIGTLLLYASEDITWLGAFFQSVSARTAGFATVDFSQFHTAGVLVMCFLMFIGASPSSVGGGLKTTTLFVLLVYVRAAATGGKQQAFRRKIPSEVFSKAFTLLLMGIIIVFAASLLIALCEPQLTMSQILFETISAYATVGLSMGVTPTLGVLSRIILIVTMFIGRVGPLTMVTLWVYKPAPSYEYSEETLTVG
jgi:trk system potassium uptake protein TrkH